MASGLRAPGPEEGDDPAAQALFRQHAEEARVQHELLTQRLHALGGWPSGMKSFLAHLFATTPKTAQLGHEESERVTQNLMMAYAVENSEIAMYESLATVAAAAGDAETERLAPDIQAQEDATAGKVFAMIPAAARSFQQLAGAKETRSA